MDDDIRDYAKAHNKGQSSKPLYEEVRPGRNYLMWQIAGGILIATFVIFAVFTGIQRYQEQQAIMEAKKVAEELEERIRQNEIEFGEERKRVQAQWEKARAERARNRETYDKLMKTCNYWRREYQSTKKQLDKSWRDRSCNDAKHFLNTHAIN